MDDERDLTGRELRQRVGANIQRAREAAGLTQEELAEAIGKQQPTISRWEMGVSSPPYSVLIRLAQALDVDVVYLFDPAAERQPNGEDAPAAA